VPRRAFNKIRSATNAAKHGTVVLGNGASRSPDTAAACKATGADQFIEAGIFL
jgi:hypothetical protein